ncbi:BnaC06g04720D [Brassica napus]|uniref:BnaC06g04720D protein n=1 Tax=Brassica napus TaxID=3708 RepID=A0A078H7P4_BRANA|nr:BnaC06g04720D [Brassica napus]
MGSSQLSQAFIVLLLLCVIRCLAESAIPSHQQPLSVIGRRLMSTGIDTRPSTSQPGGGDRTPSP